MKFDGDSGNNFHGLGSLPQRVAGYVCLPCLLKLGGRKGQPGNYYKRRCCKQQHVRTRKAAVGARGVPRLLGESQQVSGNVLAAAAGLFTVVCEFIWLLRAPQPAPGRRTLLRAWPCLCPLTPLQPRRLLETWSKVFLHNLSRHWWSLTVC